MITRKGLNVQARKNTNNKYQAYLYWENRPISIKALSEEEFETEADVLINFKDKIKDIKLKHRDL